jgi:hypothetical protein
MIKRLRNDMSERRDTKDMAAPGDEEAVAIDAPTAGDGRSKTLQVLLKDEEHEELERLAASRGLSTSTVAREAILRLVRADAAPRSAEDRRLAQDWQIYP